jgi:PAS domain-containing protein
MVRDSAIGKSVDPDAFAAVDTVEIDPALRRLFTENGTRPPLILWSPAEAEISAPLMHGFTRRMQALAKTDGRVPASAVTPEALGPLSAWSVLVDIEGPNGPFRYRHVGESILPYATRRDIIGRTSADYDNFFGAFFTALYRAAARRKEWVFSEHEPAREVFIRNWQRLIVPLFGEDGETVTRFAVMAIPENTLRKGLDLMVDPVFVLDDAQVIHHCNRAAEAQFGSGALTHDAGTTLSDVTGITLEIVPTPAELLTRGEAIDLVELVPRGGILERMAVTVSATQHRGRAFFIVVMRLMGH